MIHYLSSYVPVWEQEIVIFVVATVVLNNEAASAAASLMTRHFLITIWARTCEFLSHVVFVSAYRELYGM